MADRPQDLEAVTDAATVAKLVDIVNRIHVAESVRRYAVALTRSTRDSPDLLLGASPRATLHLVRAAKAHAAMTGRDYVVPDDVKSLAEPVLAHRLVTRGWTQGGHPDAGPLVRDILAKLKVPA